MNPVEKELLEAMGNCYRACQGTFEETLQMISGWRGYTPEEVKDMLQKLAKTHVADEEFKRLRKRFPADFSI